MICRICGSKEVTQGSSGKYVCAPCKGFFGNNSMPEKVCNKCGITYVTLPVVENTVLELVFRTTSNVKTYWRKTQCPACIVKSIREQYTQRYQKDWNRQPLDWWGKINEATISFLIKWGLNRGDVTRYELEFSRIPPKFIDFCLALGEG